MTHPQARGPGRSRSLAVGASWWALRVALVVPLAAAAAVPAPAREPAPAVTGLDHVIVAVADLDSAAAAYRRLGFALKPGRPHANGLRNRHVKFTDGTEIELITAEEAGDALAAQYLAHQARGDGPAFAGLYAPSLDEVAGRLERAGLPGVRAGGLLSFPEGARLRHIFFGGRNRSPTDRPEHFRHRNGARSLVSVWLAAEDHEADLELMAGLGATLADAEVHAPEAMKATIAAFPGGEVRFLPAARQRVPGRRIVGATVTTRDLGALQRALSAGSAEVPPVVRTRRGRSMFLPPGLTHGLWLEFLQER